MSEASNPEANPVIIRANTNREVSKSDTFVSLYTNDTQLQVTPWDVRLIFGQIDDVPTPEHPVTIVKQVGEVRMSPQHAKTIVRILTGQLEHYERTVGLIPVPKA